MDAVAISRMPVGAWLESDLLRLRRQKYGLEPPKPVDTRRLLLRGSGIGGGLLILVFLCCIVSVLLIQWLEHRQRELQPEASRFDRFQKELIVIRQRDQKLKKSNQDLATAIAGLRSGSALLTEVARLAPLKVQLTKLNIDQGAMKLSASSPQPLGLNRANAFQIMLEESPFFDAKSVELVSAIEVKAPTSSSSVSSSLIKAKSYQADRSYLAFDLNAVFSSGNEPSIRSQLQNLGATGLARRVKLLTNEGLLR